MTIAGTDIGATLSSWSTSFFQDISTTLAEVTNIGDETNNIATTNNTDNDSAPNHKAIIKELENQIANLRAGKDEISQKESCIMKNAFT